MGALRELQNSSVIKEARNDLAKSVMETRKNMHAKTVPVSPADSPRIRPEPLSKKEATRRIEKGLNPSDRFTDILRTNPNKID